MKKISALLFFLLAPLVGVSLGLAGQEMTLPQINQELLIFPLEQVESSLENLGQKVNKVQGNIGFIQVSIAEQQRQYREQQKLLQQLVKKSQEQQNLSEEIYEERILARLGTPFQTYISDRVEIKLFKLKEQGNRGYIAKVKLFDPSAIRVILAQDELGKAETTSQAVQRTGAILGINGGGFYEAVQQGQRYTLPIGTTIVGGETIGSFMPSHDDLFFTGFTAQGDLVGGIFEREEDLRKLQPRDGVSFVPILLKNGLPYPIPEKWQQEKHPRTILGQYANGDLIFMVIDGRQPGWSRGATLEEVQVKLLQLGVVEAYNLDGGGSSTFVFQGEVLNHPSDGQERPVATNIVVFP